MMTKEEAMNLVKQVLPCLNIDKKIREAFETLIPELKESDDERIRKWLIKQLSAIVNTQKAKSLDEEGYKMSIKAIAYLEKQEEQKENPKSADSISSDCVSDAKCEDRWHKVEDSLPDNGREVLAKDKLGNTLLARYDGEGWDVSVYDDEDYRCHNGISKWCEIPFEKPKEQKPVEIHIDNPNVQKIDPDVKITTSDSSASGDGLIYASWRDEKAAQKPNIELIQRSWYMEGYNDRDFNKEPKWIIKTGEGGPRYEENPKYGQHIEKQDYSGLNDFEQAIHRGFLCAGVENVPVDIIKETAQDCLAHLPVEWSEDFDKEVENIHKRYPEVSYAKLTRIAYHFSKWANRYKDIEWSEEDEKMRNALWNLLKIQYAQDYSMTGVGIEAGKFRDWLKSLPERFNLQPKPVEWNDEDEKIYTFVYDFFENCWWSTSWEISREQALKMLKSLHSRPKSSDNWKPSEEQMEALNALNCHGDLSYVGQQKQLISLYDDLKKLI